MGALPRQGIGKRQQLYTSANAATFAYGLGTCWSLPKLLFLVIRREHNTDCGAVDGYVRNASSAEAHSKQRTYTVTTGEYPVGEEIVSTSGTASSAAGKLYVHQLL